MKLTNFVEGCNNFTFNLFRKMKSKDGNVVCSPKNVQDCLAMLYSGTDNETYKAFRDSCNFPTDPRVTARCIGDINRQLSLDKECTVQMANGLWAQNSFPFDLDFIRIVKEGLNAQFATVDYKDEANHQPIADEINEWVGEQTKGKDGQPLIKNLVNKEFFNKNSVLTLVSAIYYLGKFKTKFNPALTRKQPFNVANGKKFDCQMMTQQGNYLLADTDSCQVLTVPYAGDMILTLVLPNTGTLDDIEAKLTSETYSRMCSSGTVGDTVVMFPKFKIEYETDLSEPLKSCGLEVAFSDQANFSNMIVKDTPEQQQGIKISKAVHKAYVDTTEDGTEAAAATAIGMVRSASFMPAKPPRMFRADNPFLFMITHKTTGCVLFVGRHAQPSGY